MHKLFKNILGLSAILFVMFVILLATKSQLGYPKIDELNTSSWTTSGPLELSPERARFALLYSVVEDQSFKLKTEVARLATPDLGYKNGHFVSLFAPGTSLLMIPGYKLGKLFSATHLFSTLTIGMFALFNVILIYLISKKLDTTTLGSMIAGLIFLVGTPAFTYAGIIYQHHISVFMLLSSLLLAIKKPNLLSLAGIFLLLGLSAIIDYPNVFFMIPIVLYATFNFIQIRNSKQGRHLEINPGIILSFFSIIIPVAIYLMINLASYGNIFQLSNTVSHIQALDQGGRPVAARGADARSQSDIANLGERKRNAFNFFKARHLINGLYAFSVSPDRGVLVFAPVILIGFLGIISLYRKNRLVSQVLLSVIVANILLYGMRSDPWGGWAFGARYLIPSYALLAIGLGIVITNMRKNLIIMFLLFSFGIYSIFVNTAGAISSTANPPQIEILSLEELSGRRERYSFDRNIEYLQNGKSKSFFYNTYLIDTISSLNYYYLLAGTLSAVFVFMLLVETFRKKL